MSLSQQRGDDRIDVVPHHADVSALGRAGIAHGVGEEFAADVDLVTLGRHRSLQRLHIADGHRGFDEDGGDFVLHNEVGQLLHIRRARFGRRADALQAAYVEAVGAAKVVKRIVCGDKHALFGRDAVTVELTDHGIPLDSTHNDVLAALAARSLGGLQPGDLPIIGVIGGFDVGANLIFGIATTMGLLAVISVLGSLYPVVTVLLAWLIHRERLRGVQYLGVSLALVGVIAISAG